MIKPNLYRAPKLCHICWAIQDTGGDAITCHRCWTARQIRAEQTKFLKG